MKLLLCLVCYDVQKLAREYRTCACGKAGGKYLADGLKAEVTNNPETVVLGFHNGRLLEALNEQKRKGDKPDGLGRDFLAFIIPDVCQTVKRI